MCCRRKKCPRCRGAQPYQTEQRRKEQEEARPPLVTWTGRGDLPRGQQGREGEDTAKVKHELTKEMNKLHGEVRCVLGLLFTVCTLVECSAKRVVAAGSPGEQGGIQRTCEETVSYA